MTILLYVLGVVVLLVGVGLSIGLHELGHLTFAKKFGVKVTHYMIGFGPTLFKFRRGETEYGVKLLPLGGFIAMPGMYPPKERTNSRLGAQQSELADEAVPADAVPSPAPRPGAGPAPVADDAPTAGPTPSPAHTHVDEAVDLATASPAPTGTSTQARPKRARLFERTMDEAREFSNQDIAPGEEHRTFYALSVPKRLAVMFAGPVVNLVLGIIIMFVVLVVIGTNLTPTTTVSSVVECAVPASQAAKRAQDAGGDPQCKESDPLTPAWKVGLKPGDTVVAIDGQDTHDWNELGKQIRAAAGTTVPIEIVRDGTHKTLQVPIIKTERAVTDDDGYPAKDADGKQKTQQAGFLGVSPTMDRTGIPVSQFPGQMLDMVGRTFDALIHLPQKLVGVGEVAFTDKQRDANGPVGMVGVGRVAGEIVSSEKLDVAEKALVGLNLLGGLNLFLFAFNMVPLLPLDGGHIAVGLYEGARRRISTSRGRGIVGPFDTAKLLPLTYVVTGLMLCMTLLLVYVDIFKPIQLGF